MGLPYFEMEFSTRFPYTEMVLSALFPRISAYSRCYRDFRRLPRYFYHLKLEPLKYHFLEIVYLIPNQSHFKCRKTQFQGQRYAEIVEIKEMRGNNAESTISE